MGRRNKGPKLNFDQRGGVIAISRGMLESAAYESMPASAKVLMTLLQMHWRNDRPVGYGVREAAEKIGCAVNTASKAFNLLKQRGFIICDNESLFNSKNGSKAREWRLTWMPFEYRNPTHDWEKWEPKNKATVSKGSTQFEFECFLLRHNKSIHRFVSQKKVRKRQKSRTYKSLACRNLRHTYINHTSKQNSQPLVA